MSAEGSEGARGRAARAAGRADRRPTRSSRAGGSTRRRCRRSRGRWASAGCCSRCSCARKPGGTYELVAGERRWRAAQIAGLEAIPALVRPRDDAEALELALIENMAREDLNPIEEARACAALVEELGLTREEVGRRVGRSRVAVSNLMRLLDLPDEVIELLQDGDAQRGPWPGAAAGRGPRRAPEPRAHAPSQEGWSVRIVEARARESNAGRRDGTCRAGQAPAGSGGAAPRSGAGGAGDRGGARRGARRRGAGQGRRATADIARSCRSPRPRRRSSWRGAHAGSPRRAQVESAARIGARGRLAQLVRALL